MRDYQRKKNNNFYLPPTVYRRALSLVRDYPRMTAMRDCIISESPSMSSDGGRGRGDPTAAKAFRISNIDDDIHIIERALERIPLEYRQGVMDNILFSMRRSDLIGAPSTWSRWRSRFLYNIALMQGWI